jgi:hypothetical protein
MREMRKKGNEDGNEEGEEYGNNAWHTFCDFKILAP